MDIPFIDQVRTQAQVLVPLVKHLQTELGVKRARELVKEGLREWAQNLGKQIAADQQKISAETAAQVLPMFAASNALDYEILMQDESNFDVNVTRCSYAEFYSELNEPELGFLLVCAQDFPMFDGVGGGLELIRTQTIMQGASHCDFRFRIRKSNAVK